MLKKIGYGLIVWVVPFISAIPLLGLMEKDPIFFKTLMIVIGGIAGAICVVLYFSEIGLRYLVMPAMTIPVGYILSKKIKV